jgi:Na+/proline symporter
MNYFSTDYLIVYAFLLITLVIGLRAGRGIKDMREYVLANRRFGTVALVLTFLATNIAGASVFNITALIVDDGVIITAALLALVFTFLFRAIFIAPQAAKFTHCITMGDLVGHFYGPTSKLIAGCLGILTTFCIATMELSMLGEVGYALFGWPRVWTIILGGVGSALYAAHGGIKSVTATDVFQFLVLLIGIPILAVLALEEAGGLQKVVAQVPKEKLQIVNHPEFARYLAMALIWLLPLGAIDPAIIQRLLMGRSKQALRTQYLLVAGFDPSFQLTLLLIGLAGMVLYPQIEGLQLIPHMVHNLLPIGLRGLLMAGLLGVGLSTIDSYLHVMGLTAVHDVLQPLVKNRWDDWTEVRYTRYATILLSVVAIGVVLVLHTKNFLGFLVLSLELSGPILMIPLFSGMMGLKADQKDFYAALGVTLLTFVLTRFWWFPDQEHFVALASTVANGITFFSVHVYRHRGFTIVQSAEARETVWRPQRAGIMASLQRWVPTPQQILAYSQNKIALYGSNYIPFGLFCCLNFIFPYFMWGHKLQSMHAFMLYLRILGATLCGLLIVKDKWPTSLLPYLPTFWHLTLLYCLPFTSTVMFLLTQGSVEWLINVALTIMFLITLVDWMSFTILTILGIALGFLFYTLAIGPINLHLDFSTGYLLVYTLTFSTLIALIFSRRKEQHLEAKLHEIADHYHTMGQAGAHTHPAAVRIATMIDHQVQEFLVAHNRKPTYSTSTHHEEDTHTAPDFLHYFFPTALEVIKQGTHMNKHLREVMAAVYIAPKLAVHSLQASMAAILAAYAARYQQEIDVDLEEDYRIYTSFNHLQYAFIHVLRFLHAHHLGERVSLWIARQEGVHIRLAGQAVSSSLVQELFSLFSPQETTKNMGLAISRLLIEGHGGNLLCKTSSIPGQAYTEFVLLIPPADTEVRESAEPM